ncbi:MAG: DUF512 domain-containing protein [Peptococcia bacterium]
MVKKKTGPVIIDVEPGSLAAELGLVAGEQLISVNGQRIQDLIQFMMEWADEEVTLEVARLDGSHEIFEIEKDYDEALGVSFSTAVFDGIKPCKNKCLFCFVDQMPANMRESLYVKDDDYRLSFLQGSFITLTNLTEADLARIKGQHLSPLYVSVHTTDSQLRKDMLKNPQAGRLLEIMTELSQQGIEFHTQVVLCPGINDGKYLEKTFHDLYNLPNVLSLAVVPVGITAHRTGLPVLQTYNEQQAKEVVRWVEEQQKKCLAERGTSFIWLSDEFYLQAKEELPAYEVYEDFPQLENGVGIVRLFWEQFSRFELPEKIYPSKDLTIVTGVSGQFALEPLMERLGQIKNLNIELKVIENRFFGSSVTVTGLLTGSCLLEGLKEIPPGSRVVIPQVMLEQQENRFLDNLTPEQVADKLQIELIIAPVDGKGFLDVILT